VDDQALYRFYDERLGKVFDRHTLNREIRGHHGDRFLRMRMEDICRAVPDSNELYLFPESLQVGHHRIQLSYRFEPGHEADGVTAFIPPSLVETLQPPLFEWLVPGLLVDKVAGLLKYLPKNLRRRLVPLPEAASRIMDELTLRQGSLYVALERAVFKKFQVKIERTDWQPDKLPLHLKMRYCLTGEEGKILLASRSFQDLVDVVRRKGEAAVPSAKKTPTPAPPPRVIETWDFTAPPAPIPLHTNQHGAGFLYPALFVDEQRRSVELRYIEDREESCRRNSSGLRFLHTLHFSKEVKALAGECKAALASHSASWLALGTGLAAAELRELLLTFLLDHLFATRGATLPSAREFEAVTATARDKGVARTSRQLLDSLLRLLILRREGQNRLLPKKQAKSNDLPEALRTEMQGLLRELLPPDFLQTWQYSDLAHTERYLKALIIRIERAVHAPSKDSKKAEQIAPAVSRLARFRDCASLPAECCRGLAEYRQLVEELRVSVFAPELGTAQPVSAKRLQQKWQEVENTCLRVE
jgi:ATP-dependent helicase HrpA